VATDLTEYGAPGEASDVSSLVRLAVEQKVPVEVLERLVALQERVTERNARAAFFEAIARFQERCPQIQKVKTADIVSKRTGGKFSYKYAPLDEIAHVIRPILKECGLSYSWDVALGQPGAMNVVCTLRHVEGHSERSTFPVPVDAEGGRMSAAQANAAALTFGKRQSLTSVLGIATADEDRDGARHDFAQELTPNQIDSLDSLLNETGVNRQTFFAWLGVLKLEEIKASDYGKAVKALESKR
jgi:hypothetical protein